MIKKDCLFDTDYVKGLAKKIGLAELDWKMWNEKLRKNYESMAISDTLMKLFDIT